MHLSRFTLLTAALLLPPAAARADLIGTFKLVDVQVSGTAGSGYLTGSITYDRNSNITAESIAFHNTATNLTLVYNNHAATAASALPGVARKDAFSSNSVNIVSATAGQFRTYSNLYLTYSFASATPSTVNYNIATNNSSALDVFIFPAGSSQATLAQYSITGGYLSLDTPVPSTPPAPTATPEPSSLLLLSTGILGLAAATRRRFSLGAPSSARSHRA